MIAIAPSPFEQWSSENGYDITPTVLPCPLRQYANIQTQCAYEAWCAGARVVARMVTESTLDTEALREKLLGLAK
jgi:hypothetical protein